MSKKGASPSVATNFRFKGFESEVDSTLISTKGLSPEGSSVRGTRRTDGDILTLNWSINDLQQRRV